DKTRALAKITVSNPSRETLALYTPTEKLLASKDCIYRGQEFVPRVYFQKESVCSIAQDRLCHICTVVLSCKQYLRLGHHFAYSLGHFEAIQFGKANVKHDQIRLEFVGFLNRL